MTKTTHDLTMDDVVSVGHRTLTRPALAADLADRLRVRLGRIGRTIDLVRGTMDLDLMPDVPGHHLGVNVYDQHVSVYVSVFRHPDFTGEPLEITYDPTSLSSEAYLDSLADSVFDRAVRLILAD